MADKPSSFIVEFKYWSDGFTKVELVIQTLQQCGSETNITLSTVFNIFIYRLLSALVDKPLVFIPAAFAVICWSQFLVCIKNI